jgi:hypothetical protein
VSAKATVLVNVNASSVGGRDSFLRLASNIGVETDNGSLLVTLLDNDENGARLEAKLVWILALTPTSFKCYPYSIPFYAIYLSDFLSLNS